MGWDESIFRNIMVNWFRSQRARNEGETAAVIADAYHQAAQSTIITVYGAMLEIPGDSRFIESGFNGSFNQSRNLKSGTINSNIWSSAAQGIIQYWSSAIFSIEPPPPGGSSGTSNLVSFPGVSQPLAIDLVNAFRSMDEIRCVNNLVNAFKSHLSTVSGEWIGSGTGTPPPPLTYTWVGLS